MQWGLLNLFAELKSLEQLALIKLFFKLHDWAMLEGFSSKHSFCIVLLLSEIYPILLHHFDALNSVSLEHIWPI